jgi:aspartate/tyrosine/aromatic aminotransferase
LTLRIEEAILKSLAAEYLEELEEMRSRFERLLDELLNSEEDDFDETN